MKLWIDDIRPAPEGYVWCKSVNETKSYIIRALIGWLRLNKEIQYPIGILDIDHDSGEFYQDGGDYIEILKWFEKTQTPCPPIHIHSMNPVGVENMRAIIERNNWKEIK
jgi:hypothetical protein